MGIITPVGPKGKLRLTEVERLAQGRHPAGERVRRMHGLGFRCFSRKGGWRGRRGWGRAGGKGLRGLCLPPPSSLPPGPAPRQGVSGQLVLPSFVLLTAACQLVPQLMSLCSLPGDRPGGVWKEVGLGFRGLGSLRPSQAPFLRVQLQPKVFGVSGQTARGPGSQGGWIPTSSPHD